MVSSIHMTTHSIIQTNQTNTYKYLYNLQQKDRCEKVSSMPNTIHSILQTNQTNTYKYLYNLQQKDRCEMDSTIHITIHSILQTNQTNTHTNCNRRTVLESSVAYTLYITDKYLHKLQKKDCCEMISNIHICLFDWA